MSDQCHNSPRSMPMPGNAPNDRQDKIDEWPGHRSSIYERGAGARRRTVSKPGKRIREPNHPGPKKHASATGEQEKNARPRPAGNIRGGHGLHPLPASLTTAGIWSKSEIHGVLIAKPFAWPHRPPRPRSTAGTVASRIFRSSHSDQWSMYSRSSRTHSLKSSISFRPRTCQ